MPEIQKDNLSDSEQAQGLNGFRFQHHLQTIFPYSAESVFPAQQRYRKE